MGVGVGGICVWAGGRTGIRMVRRKGGQAWRPHMRKDIDKLERVQRRVD